MNLYSNKDISRHVIELNSYEELLKLYRWKKKPIYSRPDLDHFRGAEDLNSRRVRDTESISTVVRNLKPAKILEIGTGTGASTVLLAKSSPSTKIFTLNILPEDESRSGKYNTEMLNRKLIGQEYKKLKLKNIIQIYANSLNWEANIGKIDFAFIDGAHDSKVVFSDTRLVQNILRPGGFILWHDFNPNLRYVHPWINEVTKGIEKSYSRGILKGNIFYIKDSWVGIYRSPISS